MTFERMTGAARFDAIRTADKLRVAYAGGDRGLCNLPSDPLEVDRRAGRAEPLLSARLAELLNGAGANCREIEDLPVDAQRTAAHADGVQKVSTTP